MPDLTRWRLDCKEPWHTDPEYADGGPPHYFECMVRDDTLQQIADEWMVEQRFATRWRSKIRTTWPELAVLLDGLVRVNGEDTP